MESRAKRWVTAACEIVFGTGSDVSDIGGVKYASSEDPDGNRWLLQQKTW